MSGYFDALMRSSGMTIGGPPPAPMYSEPDAFEAAADPGVTAMEGRPTDTPSMPPAALRDAGPVEPMAPPREIQPTIVHQARANPDDAPAHKRGVPDALAESKATPAVRSDEPSTPDLGARLVRAALRWVAEDTSKPGAIPDRDPLPTPRDDGLAISAAPARDGDREPPSTMTPAIVAAKTIVREPAPQVRPLVEPSRAAERPQSPQAHAATAQDETVEISIGAIHVRVDAPAAQTVARPAVMPAANTQRASGFPPRSALSRRALRRI